MTTYTVARRDTTGYALTEVAAGVESDQIKTVIADAANPWSLVDVFVVIEEDHLGLGRPQSYRHVPSTGLTYHSGPATLDPAVNRLWRQVMERGFTAAAEDAHRG